MAKEIVLLDKNGKQIGVTKRDSKCKYTYHKDTDIKVDTPQVVNNIEVTPVSFEKYYTYNMKDIAKSEKLFSDFVDGVAKIIEVRGYATISIEGSASKVPTTMFKTNDKLSRSRTNDARNRLIEALEGKGINSKKLKFKSVNSMVQGPNYKNDFEENKATYEKYQYIKLWAK